MGLYWKEARNEKITFDHNSIIDFVYIVQGQRHDIGIK
jgi:hypothetical protein